MSFRKVLGFCGACIAFYIGAGFATMQEVLQYEASYGSRFWIVIVVAALIYVYTNISFISNGHRLQLKKGNDIFEAYCGKWLGKFFNYFSAFFCYLSFIVMCGGANSTAMEQWGMPNGLGVLLLAGLVVLTTIAGLNGIVKILGILGPVIILLIIGVSLYSTISAWDNIKSGFELVDSGKYAITQVGNGKPFASGASYGGFVILWFASFLAGIGASHDKKVVIKGMLLSTIAIFGVAALCCLALIANVDQIWNVGVPSLVLAHSIHPWFAEVFAIIIFIGIYTSACPLLWTAIRQFMSEGTKQYKLMSVIGGILACIIACYIPYQPLLNLVYGLNGYLGFILMAFMIVNDIKLNIK